MNEMDVTAPKDFIHILKKVFFFQIFGVLEEV